MTISFLGLVTISLCIMESFFAKLVLGECPEGLKKGDLHARELHFGRDLKGT
jgi:hypothetical protein